MTATSYPTSLDTFRKPQHTGPYLNPAHANLHEQAHGAIEALEAKVGITDGATTLPGGQLKFPATQNASADANTLDDYEEGTWTPVVTFVTPGNLSVAYSQQSGRYTKVGNMVFVRFNLLTSTFTHSTASGDLKVTGLPFTALSLSGFSIGSASAWGGITKTNYTQAAPVASQNQAFLIFAASGSGQAIDFINASDMPTGGTVALKGALHYQV